MQRAGSPPVSVTRFAEYLLLRFVLFAWMVVVVVQLQCVWMRAPVVDFFLCANESFTIQCLSCVTYLLINLSFSEVGNFMLHTTNKLESTLTFSFTLVTILTTKTGLKDLEKLNGEQRTTKP